MGFWTDWLDPNIGNGAPSKTQRIPLAPGEDARTWWDRFCGVPAPADVRCAVCGYTPNSCRCDPDLGRPRRWWE
jgi:hypothetical protein